MLFQYLPLPIKPHSTAFITVTFLNIDIQYPVCFGFERLYSVVSLNTEAQRWCLAWTVRHA